MRPSVEEVPFAGEHHREAELVGALDDLLVAHRAARLDHRRDARRGRGLDAVGERVERVARARAAARAARGLLRRDLARLDAVLLARRRCRRPGRPSRARSRSTSRARRCATRARGRATARRVGATLVTTRQSLRVDAKWCGVLDEEAAGDLAEVERLVRRAPAPRGCACSCASLCSASIAPGVVARRDHDVGLRTRDHRARRSRRRSGGSARRCRRTRSARRTRARAGTRSRGRRRRATPHGFACLMIAHAGPVAEVVHDAATPRRRRSS